ncbi:MAG: hypothetical protein LIO75_06785 [Lachnospiraceae bacterium]|nr:hypothetical protein [Lachnospiraceae bacterium]
MGTNMAEDPVRFSRDKPKECKFCYFWHPGKKVCKPGEEKCFYIIPEAEPPEPTRCDDCPYGRVAPCIGWCTVDVLATVFGNRLLSDNVVEGGAKCQSSE